MLHAEPVVPLAEIVVDDTGHGDRIQEPAFVHLDEQNGGVEREVPDIHPVEETQAVNPVYAVVDLRLRHGVAHAERQFAADDAVVRPFVSLYENESDHGAPRGISVLRTSGVRRRGNGIRLLRAKRQGKGKKKRKQETEPARSGKISYRAR